MPSILLKNSAAWVEASLSERLLQSAVIVATCFLGRWLLREQLDPYLPTEFFFLGAMLVALRFGFVAGVISLAAGWMLGILFFIEPYGRFSEISDYDIVVTADNFVTGLAGIAVLEYLQRTRYSQKLMLLVSESRYRSLLRLDNHRIHQRRSSVHSLKSMSELLTRLDNVLAVFDSHGRTHLMPAMFEVDGVADAAKKGDWLACVHPHDRDEAARKVEAIMAGTDSNGTLCFRRILGQGRFERLECELRMLHRVGDRQFYVLTQSA